MKIHQIPGFPKEIDILTRGQYKHLPMETIREIEGKNKMIEQIGNLEVKLNKEKIVDIVFENHHGKTLGDCAKAVAQALADNVKEIVK